jgi:hypothetical protein
VDQQERIVLEAEEGPVLESVGKANAALERYEKSGAKASQTVGKSFNQSGETIIRSMDRSRASAERLVASIEKKAAMSGKTGVQKLVAEREVLIRRLAGEERAIQRAKTAYGKLIAAQRRSSDSNRDFGASIRDFVQNPLHSAGNMVQGFIGRLGAIGTAAAAAAVGVGLAVKASMSLVTALGTEADLMSNLAERTGLTLNQIDRLQAMATLADVNLKTMEQGVRQLASGLSGVGRGGDMAREAIQRLGIQVYDTTGQKREMGQVLIEVLQALGGVQNQAERVAVANSILGIGAKELLPLIRNYSELEGEVTKLGFGMDEHLLKRLGQGSDEIDKLKMRWDLLVRHLLAKPALAVVDVVVKVAGLADSERKPFDLKNPVARLKLQQQGIDAGDGDLGGVFGLIRERAGIRAKEVADDRRRRADEFRQSLAAKPEGLRARLQEIGKEQEPLAGALLSGQLAPDAFAQKRGEYDRLEHEKASIEAGIKALDEAKRESEQKAKVAEKLRAEIDLYKRRVHAAAIGGHEVVALDKDVIADTERTTRYQEQIFRSHLGDEQSRLAGEIRDIEKVLQEAQRVDEKVAAGRIAGLEREAQLNEQLIRLRTGPGGEAEAVEDTYRLRLEYAQREFDIHKDRARFLESVQEAEIDRVSQVAELERRRFDGMRHAAEGIFDALLTRSRSLGDAVLDIFRTSVLTPIKQAFSTMIAGALTPGFSRSGIGTGGVGSVGGLLGGLGMPSLGGFGIPGAPGGTPGFAGPVGLGGSSSAGVAPWAGLGASATGLSSLFYNSGSIALGGGAATTAAGIGGLGGVAMGILTSPAALMGGGLLAAMGLQRGGWSGVGMSAAGGALIGTYLMPGLGTAIGAGIGAAAGLIRKLVGSAEDKLRKKIRAVYGVEMRDKGLLSHIVQTAKQGFGGNLDVAIRSPQVRDLIELYAMSTEQRMSGMPATVRPVSLVQSGGSLHQAPGYSNGSVMSSMGGVPMMEGGSSAASQPIVVKLDGPATTALLRGEAVQAIVENPRAVQGASMKAARSNAGRRELTSLQVSPGLLTA